MCAKAATSEADVLMLDLEDSVPSSAKPIARSTVVESLQKLKGSSKLLSVRINSVGTPWVHEDILAVVRGAPGIVERIVLPKIESASAVHFVDHFLSSLELELGLPPSFIAIEASIESAKGLVAIGEIASASPNRLRSLNFGIADFSASIGARMMSGVSGHGDGDELIYPGHRWHFVMSSIAVHAKANGLLAIDAPFGHFKDLGGLAKSAQMAAALGFDGKWAIHPTQIGPINEAFTPSKSEIERATTIIKEHEAAVSRSGAGAVSISGAMADQATLRLAKYTLFVAKSLGIYEGN